MPSRPLVLYSRIIVLPISLTEKESVLVFRAGSDGTGFVCESELSNTVRYLLSTILTTSLGFA